MNNNQDQQTAINAQLQTLEQQRNQAMNQVVFVSCDLALANAKISTLEEQIKSLQNELQAEQNSKGEIGCGGPVEAVHPAEVDYSADSVYPAG